jgi:hypothetical protein
MGRKPNGKRCEALVSGNIDQNWPLRMPDVRKQLLFS